MYAAWLVNTEGKHYKSYFVASWTMRIAGKKQPIVKVAWGTIGDVDDDRQYEGPKGSTFTDKKHADNYARTIVRSKLTEDYQVMWDIDSDQIWPDLDDSYPLPSSKLVRRYSGNTPAWWIDVQDIIERRKAKKSKSGHPPAVSVSTISGRKFGGGTGDGDPFSSRPIIKGIVVKKRGDSRLGPKKRLGMVGSGLTVPAAVTLVPPTSGRIAAMKSKLKRLAKYGDDDDEDDDLLVDLFDSVGRPKDKPVVKAKAIVTETTLRRKPRFEFVPRKKKHG